MSWILTTLGQLIFTLFMYGMGAVFFGAAMAQEIFDPLLTNDLRMVYFT